MGSEAAGLFGWAIFRASVTVLALLALAYPFYRLLSLYFDRVLTGSEALLSFSVLLLLFVGIIASWGTLLGWLLLGALLVGLFGTRVLNQLAERAALRRMEDEDIIRFTETLRQQPRNVEMHVRLARIFLNRAEYALAMSHVKQALELNPKDPALEALQKRIATEWRRAEQHLKVCPKCFAENPELAAACFHCGFRFTDPADLLRILKTPPALAAAKWSGLLFLFFGLLLLVWERNVLAASLFTFFGAASIFWHLYVVVSRRL